MEGIRKGFLFCQRWYIKGEGEDTFAQVIVKLLNVNNSPIHSSYIYTTSAFNPPTVFYRHAFFILGSSFKPLHEP